MMAEGRQRDSWSHTSAVLALVANTHRDPRRRSAFRPQDFDPFAEKSSADVPKADITVLKRVFCRKGGG